MISTNVRISAAFSPTQLTGCADPDCVPATYSGGRLYLTAVLCQRDERINSVRARASGAPYKAMVASAMRTIFPRKFRREP